MVKIRDAFKKQFKQRLETNEIKTGIDTYAGDDQDPIEIYSHDNAGVAGPDEEDE